MAEDLHTGTITRISLKNFVTYDDVVVKPGKNLNLIIGANGTGKSTIVSAIVLGLGGNPKVIGRGSHVADFVKAGKQSAVIEIDLQTSPNKCITVTRTFDLQNHTSWMVNNKTVNGKQISDLMGGFNIQVDNLCQFLPQDKVQEFSNMSPYELLTETERSVGDPRLLENHSKLKQYRAKQAELEKELQNTVRLHAKEVQTYNALKDSVGHINEQKQIKKKLKQLKQKKAWLQYQNKREEFQKAKKERDAAEVKKKEVELKLKPVEQEISKLKMSIQTLEKTAKQHNSETSAKTMKLNKFLDEIEKCERNVDDTEAQCDLRVKEEQECDDRIEQMRQQKNRMENDLRHLIDNVGTVERLQAEHDQAASKMQQHKRTLNELETQQNFMREKVDYENRKIRAEERNLQEVENIENKRLELLQKLSNDAYKGVLWLRSNHHLFSRPVHEPMLLQINLKDASYSKYFENIIPQRDLVAFVCEDKNDMNLLVQYLRDQQKLKINAVHSDPDKHVSYEPSIPLNSIQQYGFEHYLISLIEAPRTILNYLVNMYKINKIPIGSNKVAANLEHIPDSLFRFFSTCNSYSVNRSKYTREKSTRQASISSRGILAVTVDADRLRSIQHLITTSREKIAQHAQELESIAEKYAPVHAKIEALKEIKNNANINLSKIQNLSVRINVNDQNILNLQNGRRSIDEIRLQYKGEIEDAILRQLKFYQQYNKMLDDCYKNIIINEEMKLQINLKKNNLALKENDSHDLRAEFSAAERDYKLLENELIPLKKEIKNMYDIAKDSTDGLCANDPKFAPIQTAFAKLPATIEEIFEEIKTTQAKIFCLSNDQDDSNRILERFNMAKKNMDKLDQVIKDRDTELTNITEEISKVNEEWFPMLTSLIEKINNNFSNYFTKMKCAGEVSLLRDNHMDFDKYGLQIKVKFRDADELQVLTRTHQSGGERAVTTAVYMISLQELTRVPFRCVDEINQGMDATNERRIFELIVNITSKENSPQYFLLTPKLLPNLKYSDYITVLTVCNGKYMLPCSEFDFQNNYKSVIDTVTRRQSAVR